MNKKDIMRQPDMRSVVVEMIRSRPGITSARLFETCKEWAGKSWSAGDTHEFDRLLLSLRTQGFICTNKQWQESGYVEPREPKGPPKVDPRQLRMDW